MDGVLVDFQSGIDRLSETDKVKYKEEYDNAPYIFSKMEPNPKAIESFKLLCEHYDVYILSTSPWENPTALNDKLEWVKKHIGNIDGQHAHKKIIFSHHKNLNKGHFLIDDRKDKRGANKFEGELLHFGPDGNYKNWDEVIRYLIPPKK
jgi:5'(3')-deoxyribonucleotidase